MKWPISVGIRDPLLFINYTQQDCQAAIKFTQDGAIYTPDHLAQLVPARRNDFVDHDLRALSEPVARGWRDIDSNSGRVECFGRD
jgi:hypothetical protein